MVALLVVASVAMLLLVLVPAWRRYRTKRLADRRVDALQVLGQFSERSGRRVIPVAVPGSRDQRHD